MRRAYCIIAALCLTLAPTGAWAAGLTTSRPKASSHSQIKARRPLQRHGVLFGDQRVESFAAHYPAGMAQAFAFTDHRNGTASSISVYVDSRSGAHTLLAGLYSNAGGHPGQL